MRRADAVCALFLLAVGGMALYDARQYGVFGWGPAGPEPGMYPFLLGLGISVGSLIVLARAVARRRGGQPDTRFIPPGGLRPVLCVAVPAALMVFLTQFIGLYVAAGLYLATYMRWIGKHRWATTAAVSILLPLAGYLLFEKWFLIPLPEGSLTAPLRF